MYEIQTIQGDCYKVVETMEAGSVGDVITNSPNSMINLDISLPPISLLCSG